MEATRQMNIWGSFVNKRKEERGRKKEEGVGVAIDKEERGKRKEEGVGVAIDKEEGRKKDLCRLLFPERL